MNKKKKFLCKYIQENLRIVLLVYVYPMNRKYEKFSFKHTVQTESGVLFFFFFLMLDLSIVQLFISALHLLTSDHFFSKCHISCKSTTLGQFLKKQQLFERCFEYQALESLTSDSSTDKVHYEHLPICHTFNN